MAAKINVRQTLESKTIIQVLTQPMRLVWAEEEATPVSIYFRFLAKKERHYHSSLIDTFIG